MITSPSFLEIGFIYGFVELLGLLDLLVKTFSLFRVAFDANNASKDIVCCIKCQKKGY